MSLLLLSQYTKYTKADLFGPLGCSTKMYLLCLPTIPFCLSRWRSFYRLSLSEICEDVQAVVDRLVFIRVQWLPSVLGQFYYVKHQPSHKPGLPEVDQHLG